MPHHASGGSPSRQLLLFVHGLGGSELETWRQFSDLARSDPALERFDVGFFSYPSSAWLRRPWKRMPRVQLLAEGLHTEIENRHQTYSSIVLVAHSLGGLVARRYLVDRILETAEPDPNVRPLRISKLVLYAVPNDGAGLANVARYVSWRQPQIRQLCRKSDFLEDLNREWEKLNVGSRLEIKYVVAAQDNVVDADSARGLQGVRRDVAVLADRDHRTCVRPKSRDDLCYQVMKNFVLEPLPSPHTPSPQVLDRLKVVGFDLDGTLIRGLTFSWTRVWQYLKYPDDLHRAGMKSYLSEKCTYQEWCDWAVDKFRGQSLTEEALVGLARDLTVTKNLHSAIDCLKRAGFRLALISGGIDTFLYAKIPDADELFDDVFINRLKFDEQGIICGVDATKYDFQGKAKALEIAAERAGGTLENAVFVGDGFNDAPVSRQARLTIAYPPHHEEQSSLADIHIEEDDLMRVAEAILNTP